MNCASMWRLPIGPLAEIPEAEEEEQWQEEIRLSSSEGASTPVLDSRPDTRVVCISRARELSGIYLSFSAIYTVSCVHRDE